MDQFGLALIFLWTGEIHHSSKFKQSNPLIKHWIPIKCPLVFTGLLRVHTVTTVQVLITAELFQLYSSAGKAKCSSFKMVLKSNLPPLIQAKNKKVWI